VISRRYWGDALVVLGRGERLPLCAACCEEGSRRKHGEGCKCKWHFTLWPLVERTKDLNNLITGEQKFGHLTLEVSNQQPSKRLCGNTFWEFWC
jgi:hypothetical protein